MRIASVKPNDLAVVTNDVFILIGDELRARGLLRQSLSMIDFIAAYETLKDSLDEAVTHGKKVPIDSGRLKLPVERPSKIWAAAFNYKRERAISKTPPAAARR